MRVETAAAAMSALVALCSHRHRRSGTTRYCDLPKADRDALVGYMLSLKKK